MNSATNGRRRFLAGTAAATAAALAESAFPGQVHGSVRHLLTLSFDDGFLRSSQRTAEIHEKVGVTACINVIASGHLPDFVPPDEYHVAWPRGDFGLWNDLRARGHEVMPHGYRHANLAELPLAEAQGLVRRCLDLFQRELEGFEPERAIFNFPYNRSTPELEAWLGTQVRAFRTGGGGLNPLPSGQQRLTTTGHGPENCERHLDAEIEALLGTDSGWLVYNVHGLDDEGWGPIRASYLERLLDRLLGIETLRVLPVAPALDGLVSDGTWRAR